ncbi:esterase/lipase family protein [Alkalimarinus sediminis]|uniref:Triacylglycerol lipase n=1 Tax=Alkalimarinus sediminis TaxID=1632866 RepID=A0A9E8KNF3_9ALTE|nr:triacylglycerol lipase [Alkalimarinus sediminis]UZW73639.1 triacylglycerol lipase [Alkalimarinus sediminis]
MKLLKPKTLFAAAALTLGLGASNTALAGGSASNYTETEYPIVLVHGFFGFDSILGIVDYWYGIPEALEKEGADVHVVVVSATHSPEVRGEQLVDQIEDILAETGAEKVNLIGHSHGSPTSRYAAAVIPNKVASVTGVAGVNNGVEYADAVAAGEKDFIAGILPYLADLMSFVSGNNNPNDLAESLSSMSTERMNAFNASYPAGSISADSCGEGEYSVNGINYYSWSGRTDQTAHQTDLIDPTDFLFTYTGTVYHRPNDGLVATCTSHLGQVIRDDYFLNHLDTVNGLLGMTNDLTTDAVEIFVNHANRLKQAGL